MADLNLYINIRTRVAELIDGMRRSRESVEDVQPTVGRLDAAFSKLKVGIAAFLAVYAGMSMLKQFAEAVIDTSAKFETLNTRLNTLTQNSLLAQRAMVWIKQFTAETPFGLDDVSEAYLRLIGVGIDAEAVLKPIGDAVAAIGGGGEELNRVTTAFAQMQSKGKASSEELMQIAELGIPAFQILKEELKLTSKQMEDIGNAGYNVNEIIAALSNGMEQRFSGAMKKQSETFTGLIGLISDQWVQFLAEVGDAGFFDTVKLALQDVLNLILELKETGKLAEIARQISDALSVAFGGLKILVEGFGLLSQAIALPFDMIYKLGMFIGSGFDTSVFQMNAQTMADAAGKSLSDTSKAQADFMLKEKELQTKINAASQDLAEKRTKFQIGQWEEEKKAQESMLSEAENLEKNYAKKIEDLRKGLTDFTLSLDDTIRAKKRESMSDSRAQADTEAQINEKLLASKQALAAGDEQAAKARADEAAGLAGQLDNNRKSISYLVEAGQAAKAARAQEISSTEQAKEANQDHIESLKNNLQFISMEMEKLGVPRETVIKADITDAESKLNTLLQQLNSLRASTTMSPSIGVDGGAGFADGGKLPGYSNIDTIPASTRFGHRLMLAGGEFITNSFRTRMFEPVLRFINSAPLSNVQNTLSALSRQPVIGLAGGGAVPTGDPAAAASPAQQAMVNLNWSIGAQRGTLLADQNSLPRFLSALESELKGVV